MRLHVELDRAADGRWVGAVSALPGAMAYGRSRAEAIAVAQALALRILLDRWTSDPASARRSGDPVPGGLSARAG